MSGEPTASGVRGVALGARGASTLSTSYMLWQTKTQRLRGTTVPVQDGTGMEICNANCACANCWVVPLSNDKSTQ